MKKILILLALLPLLVSAQDQSPEGYASRIFLPSIEIGYFNHGSELLGAGLITKTSLEYRFRNNNDFFLRINYDQHRADFQLEIINGTSNVIEGTASFTDALLGPGYRFGDRKLRAFVMFQAGLDFYNFPVARQSGTTINIEQGLDKVFCTRATLGFEYYFNEKAAFSVDFFQNQIWERKAFWPDRGDAWGISAGVITSLF